MEHDTQNNVCVIPDVEPWISGRQLANVLTQAGYETYAAGGCVRDLILSRVIQDIDLATAAHPEQVEKICAQHGWQLRCVPAGELAQHLTREVGVLMLIAKLASLSLMGLIRK